MKILVTGVAGFIGYHLCLRLLAKGYEVVGLDSINDYYDPQLKFDRLKELGISKKEASVWNDCVKSSLNQNFSFYRLEIQDRERLPLLFEKTHFDIVCNFAAQAGVRYSIENPEVYIDSNVVGFLNILECCRNYDVTKVLYASSSSVYGDSGDVPFKESQSVDTPISVYAATKKSNELLAHTYNHLFKIKCVGLRFFTVYGPWCRPDMALFLFTEAILKRKPIKVYNNGDLSRDFTYISDIIDGVLATIQNIDVIKKPIYNIGNNKPVRLLDFIEAIEKELKIEAKKEFLPMQLGDVHQTWADVSCLEKDLGYTPKINIEEGIRGFIKWYKKYIVNNSAFAKANKSNI